MKSNENKSIFDDKTECKGVRFNISAARRVESYYRLYNELNVVCDVTVCLVYINLLNKASKTAEKRVLRWRW